MSTVIEKKQRKKNARHRDIVFGALDERLEMLSEASNTPELIASNIARVRELIDELKRATGRETEE